MSCGCTTPIKRPCVDVKVGLSYLIDGDGAYIVNYDGGKFIMLVAREQTINMSEYDRYQEEN